MSASWAWKSKLAGLRTGVVAGCAMFLLAAAAQASPITYIFTGVGSGSLDGQSFEDATFSVSLLADTTTVSVGASQASNAATTTDFTLGALSGTFDGVQNSIIENTGSFGASFPIIVFGQSQSAAPFFVAEGLSNAAFPTYDLTSAFPLTSGPVSFDVQTFQTSAGDLTFDGISSLSFQAVTGVPEPATWSLMLVGVLGAGAAMRLSRKRMAPATAS
jgi:hypothetical protein